MGTPRVKPEQIISKLMEAEVLLAKGLNIAQASKQIGITEQTYYRWRREYGELKVPQAKRLKKIEEENGRLRRAVSDQTLDKLILQDAARGNF